MKSPKRSFMTCPTTYVLVPPFQRCPSRPSPFTAHTSGSPKKNACERIAMHVGYFEAYLSKVVRNPFTPYWARHVLRTTFFVSALNVASFPAI